MAKDNTEDRAAEEEKYTWCYANKYIIFFLPKIFTFWAAIFYTKDVLLMFKVLFCY